MCYVFLNAYGRHCKCGCLNNEQSLLWNRILIWAGHWWRTESTIYMGLLSRNTSQDFWNVCPEYYSFLTALSMCIYLKMPFCHDLLFSPKHFSHCFFSIFRGRWRTKFSTPKLSEKKKIKSISHFHTLLFHFQNKQSYI